MSRYTPRGLRSYDKVRKVATFEFIVPNTGGRKRIQRTFEVTGWDDAIEQGARFRAEMTRKFDGTAVEQVDDDMTFAQYVEREWEGSIGLRISARKRITCESILTYHLVPHFGHVPLKAITDAHAEDFAIVMRRKKRVDGKPGNYSPSYINSALSLLRTILRHAFRRRVIRELPLREPLPFQVEPKLRNELTVEEEQRFLAAFDSVERFAVFLTTPARRRHSRHFTPEFIDERFARFTASKPIFNAALQTGLRRDDLRLLRWSSVDLDRRIITVTMQKTKEVALIPISSSLLGVLKPMRGRSTKYVFTTERGLPYSVSTLTRYFSIAKSLAGITRRVRLHDLRHTFGSKLASAGVSTAIIRRCLGHTTARMAERYCYPSDEAVLSVVEALGG